MKLHNLHSFTPEDWKKLESQFAGFSSPTMEFVTENKGSIAEAESIYTEAFVYYTQLIELRGPKIMDQAEQIIYSFSRKLWIQKLEKRNVDIDFVSYRRAFYSMDDAFDEIDSINNRSEKTAEKLALVGEPARTLIIEHIGLHKKLAQLAPRFGIDDEAKAFSRIAKSLRKLIKDSDSKNFAVSDPEFEILVRFVLDNNTGDSVELSEDKKVGVTIISRTIAMVRSYVNRKSRLQRLKEMQERIEPDTHSGLDKASVVTNHNHKQKKMKPLAILAFSAIVALTVSIITAFGLSGIVEGAAAKKVEVPPADTIQIVIPKVEPVKIPDIEATAFAISTDGLFLTTSALSNRRKVRLVNSDLGLDAKVVYVDTVLGISILKSELEKPLRMPYRFSPDDAKIGQEIYSVGYPEKDFFYTKGTLNSLEKKNTATTDMPHSAAGSPVISDHGQILGMVLHNHFGDGSARIIQISKLKSALDAWAEKSETKLLFENRNGLYYSDRTVQIEKLNPYIFKVK